MGLGLPPWVDPGGLEKSALLIINHFSNQTKLIISPVFQAFTRLRKLYLL